MEMKKTLSEKIMNLSSNEYCRLMKKIEEDCMIVAASDKWGNFDDDQRQERAYDIAKITIQSFFKEDDEIIDRCFLCEHLYFLKAKSFWESVEKWDTHFFGK